MTIDEAIASQDFETPTQDRSVASADDLHENGSLIIEENVDGWSVYAGCEGDDPRFLAFFVDRGDAAAFVALRDPDDAACSRHCDPQITVAFVPSCIVSSNHFKVETHEALRKEAGG